MSTEVMQSVEKVNSILLANEPGNITTDEHAGYTGYKPQSIVDAMNEGVGIGKWGFEEVSSEIIPGEKGGLAIAQVQVWLAGVDFKPTSWGQNRITRGDVGDAKKAAQTDAIKKGLSYFSIGNRAYHGLLKEDSKPRPAPRPIAQPRPSAAPAPVQDADTEKRLAQVRAIFDKMFKADRWDSFKQHHLGMPVSDEGLSMGELDKLYSELMRSKQQAKSA